MKNQRRDFLKTSGKALAASAFVNLPFAPTVLFGNSEETAVNVGLIGCRGMGWNNLKSFLKNPGVSVRALCDVDNTILEQRKTELASQNIFPEVFADHRKLLEMKDIQAVIIATPDHWHCLQLIDALKAGKDVYVEKPLANSIAESRAMVKAVRSYPQMVQVNQWQRSQAHFQNAVQYVRSGKLGKIALVKVWMHRANSQPLPVSADENVPPGVDYERWLGPARRRPFNKNRFHYEFRWFWDYAGGLMTDWGVHLLDVACWGMNCSYPKAVLSSGGKYVFSDDARETPDTQNVLYQFNDFDISWEHTLAGGRGYFNQGHGIAFIGKNGTLIVSRKGWEVIPEKDLIEAVPFTPSTDNGLDLHVVNFLEAVKTRDAGKLNCPVQTGSLAAEISHMGNIAFQTREHLLWKEKEGEFASRKANRLIAPDYQNGYKLPDFR